MLNYLLTFVLYAGFWLVCCWPFAFRIAKMLKVVICGASDTANSSPSSKLGMRIFRHTHSPKGQRNPLIFGDLVSDKFLGIYPILNCILCYNWATKTALQ